MKINKNILLIFGGLVMAFMFAMIAGSGTVKKKETVKIGLVLTGSKDETGWNGAHYNDVAAACRELGVELAVKEMVEENTGKCETAVRELIKEGVSMILLSSYEYPEELEDVTGEYPEIVFYGISPECQNEDMTSYFGRMYQARYLAGIVAGFRTETNRIGYVAAMPNNEVNRGINAFTLGAKRANPEATVVVAWSGTWDDRERETFLANQLIEKEQVDVLTCHQNQNYVVEAAEAAGIDSIGYHAAVQGLSEHYLTAAVWNWEVLYQEVIRDFMQGKGNKAGNYWLGIDKGVIGLSEYSGRVTEDARNEVEAAKSEMLEGKEVFSGTIHDTEGKLKCDEQETISDEMLLGHSDWFAEGVEFYEE